MTALRDGGPAPDYSIWSLGLSFMLGLWADEVQLFIFSFLWLDEHRVASCIIQILWPAGRCEKFYNSSISDFDMKPNSAKTLQLISKI